MKTLIVYSLIPEETKFFLVDGDRRELNGLFINSTEDIPEHLEDELSSGTEWGTELETPLVLDVVDDDCGFVIVNCGFVL